MGSSSDGSPAARGALHDDNTSDEADQAPRGFFGRILDALTPSDPKGDGPPETGAGQVALPPGSGQLGLANLELGSMGGMQMFWWAAGALIAVAAAGVMKLSQDM